MIDQVVARYSIIWSEIRWVVDISEKYWMQICLKNNWKVINAKLKHKFYLVLVNKHTVINEILDKLHNQEKTYWTQSSALYACSVFVTWQIMYKNEKLIQKKWAVIDLQELNHATVSDVYSLLLQLNIIMSILSCKYISVMNRTDFFYQWWMTVKDHEKFTIISHCDLEIVSIALMNYQEFSSYAQHMMNMIFRFHKFFVYCYINNIVIFSKILKNHFKHLNIIFNLFNELKITLKEIKTHLNYSLIILLNQ